MTTLYLNNGSVLITEHIPNNWEGIYCQDCGTRLGWIDPEAEVIGSRAALCDYCMADFVDEQAEEEGADDD